MSPFYKRTLYGLSTGKVLEGVWLARGKFMGCEGQFEQPADGVQNRHVTFLPLTLSNITSKGKKEKPRSPRKPYSRSKLFLSGNGMDLCAVNCSLILNKEVTVGGTWHALLAPQARLQVMAGCFV